MRKDELRNLFQVPPGDVQGSDVWPEIKRGVVDALLDQDEQLSVSYIGGCSSKQKESVCT